VANSGIHWMEPRDLTMADIARGIQPQGGVGVSSGHESGAHVVFADGHVQLMSKDTSPEVLRSLATIDGSEPYDPQEEERNRQTKAAAREASRRNAAPFTFVLMIISGLILAFRPLRKLGNGDTERAQ
ncbi:MAG TPA: H-X9-DG-CTERM domain-containing protein, partial [Thermoguttaceae bacterium]|nr:H-X9-DG-CTERM domain-containing protein [Thermoguttaceae bacterium]